MKYLVLIPFVALLLIPIIQAYSMDGTITVSTDKKSYVGGPVKISGTISQFLPTIPIKVVITNPKGNVVYNTQIFPDPDNTYTVQVITAGFLWQNDGNYQVNVYYQPKDNQDSTTFNFQHSMKQTTQSEKHVLSDIGLEKWIRKIDGWLVNGDISPLEAISPFSYLVQQNIITKDQNTRISDKIGFIDHMTQVTVKCIKDHREGKTDVAGESFCLTGSYTYSNTTNISDSSIDLFTIKVLKCDPTPGGEYIDVGGQITNNDNVSHTPELVYKGKDSTGNIITFELGYSDEIQPDDTVFVDRLIKNDSTIDSCSISINHAN